MHIAASYLRWTKFDNPLNLICPLKQSAKYGFVVGLKVQLFCHFEQIESHFNIISKKEQATKSTGQQTGSFQESRREKSA